MIPETAIFGCRVTDMARSRRYWEAPGGFPVERGAAAILHRRKT